MGPKGPGEPEEEPWRALDFEARRWDARQKDLERNGVEGICFFWGGNQMKRKPKETRGNQRNPKDHFLGDQRKTNVELQGHLGPLIEKRAWLSRLGGRAEML